MPIITPTPPFNNSARNVARSTLTELQQEFYVRSPAPPQ
jgi:hypothetical protein